MGKAFWIQAFLFLHVVGAIVAVGPSLTYVLWRRRAETTGRSHLVFVHNTIRWMDSRLATPAFGAQAVTGVALTWLVGWSFFHTAWLLVGVGIYVLIAVLAPPVYVPMVRRQRELAERMEAEPDDPALAAEYAEASARARRMALLIVALTFAIVYFMVWKPALWSAG